MSESPINLNLARADRNGDARLVSVSDALEGALAESRDGRWTKALMIFYRPCGDGTFETDTRCAGVSTLEARGLMFCGVREEILE